jgi:pyruvate dehydrogenase E1 component
VFFQPHAAPGVYARAWLEGRLSEAQLDNYRRETGGKRPVLVLPSLADARFLAVSHRLDGPRTDQRDLPGALHALPEHRGIQNTAGRKVWAFVGDGEMDEPESLAGLSLASREGLDNLIFVVNCNLQRLDGPVRGNGSIIQELEGLFAGAGWHVIKLLWGSEWDPLFARDHDKVILRRLHETVDGEFQKYAATDGRFNREHFFNKYPELQALVVAPLRRRHRSAAPRRPRSGEDLRGLPRRNKPSRSAHGDPRPDQEGLRHGPLGPGKMTTHQQKKLDAEALLAFRDRFALPLTDEQVTSRR